MTDPGLLILSSLAEGDKHGYGIMLDVQQFAGVDLGPGTLYGAITRLVDCGWIRPLESEDRRRRPYRLTAEGRTHLAHEMERLDRVVRTALGRLKPA
jgi:DNA-binding PadR family transcriptional regulator